MKKCATCGNLILLGGKQDGALRYCNAKCQQIGALVARSRQIPPAEVQPQVMEVHQGLCPRCHGPGPVDVHVSHRVWSALYLTSWVSRSQICCASCGTRSKLLDSLYSLVLGWWGIPWGLVMTPIQIGRNLVGLARPVDPSRPSPRLENAVRMQMAARSIPGAAPAPALKAA